MIYMSSLRNAIVAKNVNQKNALSRAPMGNFFEVKRHFQKLFIDFLGPYTRSADGNSYIFIVVDQFSKFVFLEPMRVANSKNVTRFLENRIFTIFSVPEIIVSDNASQFTSKEFTDFLLKHGIRHITLKPTPVNV